MRVILAGYNLDSEVIAQARELGVAADQLTPETLSAAYARISRHPAPVDQLRQQARQEVARARASNEQIIFGLGHASVAEHAVFNFDLLELSRLAIEALEHSRLCSYTEKSQRYIRLDSDHVVPAEVSEAGLRDAFEELLALQHESYRRMLARLQEYHRERCPELAQDKRGQRTLEGWAQEDARYVTSLATCGQLGMTLNARSLERMVRRLSAHPLREVQALGAALLEAAEPIAPSLLRYTKPAGEQAAAQALDELARELLEPETDPTLPGAGGVVQLVSYTPESDVHVVAALLHGAASLPWAACYARAQALSEGERTRVVRTALSGLGPHDPPPRALELVSCHFDVVVSASCFAQLKRHRLATLLVQPYDPLLGYTMPPAIETAGLSREFQHVMVKSTALFHQLAGRCPQAAPYALTQAHRRRVLVAMNGRELYHFSRLRQDKEAQWDIRQLADRMLHLAKQQLPLSLMLTGGKDQFARLREQVLGESS